MGFLDEKGKEKKDENKERTLAAITLDFSSSCFSSASATGSSWAVCLAFFLVAFVRGMSQPRSGAVLDEEDASGVDEEDADEDKAEGA